MDVNTRSARTIARAAAEVDEEWRASVLPIRTKKKAAAEVVPKKEDPDGPPQKKKAKVTAPTPPVKKAKATAPTPPVKKKAKAPPGPPPPRGPPLLAIKEHGEEPEEGEELY